MKPITFLCITGYD